MTDGPHEDKGQRPASVGELIGLMSLAYGVPQETVIEEIIRMALPLGGETDPTRETMRSYLKAPTRMPVSRANRDTPLHQKFAHLAINYLDGRRPDGVVVQSPLTLTNPPAAKKDSPWGVARDLCKIVLKNEHDRRYERFLGGDQADHARVPALVGAYAVTRRESSDDRYRQELLILSDRRKKTVPRCHCTYVSHSVVMRGEWMVIGDMIYCHMSGLRDNNTQDICNIYLSYSEMPEILLGLLAGPGTPSRYPVAMPAVVMRIAGAGPDIHELGDLGDTAILNAMRENWPDLSALENELDDVLDLRMKRVSFGPNDDSVRDLRARFPQGQGLVGQQLVQFCRGTVR